VKRIILSIVCVAIAVSVAGCNTVRGAGKDIERAGEGIQNSTK
jgi:predicted small secreted protein